LIDLTLRFKQAIVVRADLKMSVGKIAAQVAHASVSSMEEARRRHPDWVEAWFETGQKKVVLKVATLEQLEQVVRICTVHGLPYAVIEDAGLTELPPGTRTTVGIGPAPENEIDRVTGSLPLL
jgi:PTH2 family peptidyl-tRNA hydrolase